MRGYMRHDPSRFGARPVGSALRLLVATWGVVCLLVATAWAQPAAPSNLSAWGEPRMSIAAGPHTFAVSSNGSAITTSAIDTTGMTLLVMSVSYYQPNGPGTVSDSKGNTWVAAGTAGNTGEAGTALFYVKNPTVGTGHTFTAGTGVTTFPGLFVAAFSGTDTTANRDQENSAATQGVTTLQPGSVTPTVDNELVVTSLGTPNDTTSITIGSGFTMSDSASHGGNNMGGGLAYIIQTTAQAVNPTWTVNTAMSLAAAIDTFKPAAGGAAAAVFRKTISALGTRTGSRQAHASD